MADLLYCHAIGRLGRAPETAISQRSGKQFVKFTIAVNKPVIQGQAKTDSQTTWIYVAVFDHNLVQLASSLTVGTLVYVAGNLSVTVKNGKTWLDMIAHSVIVLRNGRSEHRPDEPGDDGGFGDPTPF